MHSPPPQRRAAPNRVVGCMIVYPGLRLYALILCAFLKAPCIKSMYPWDCGGRPAAINLPGWPHLLGPWQSSRPCHPLHAPIPPCPIPDARLSTQVDCCAHPCPHPHLSPPRLAASVWRPWCPLLWMLLPRPPVSPENIVPFSKSS